jgi:hypothetical protein
MGRFGLSPVTMAPKNIVNRTLTTTDAGFLSTSDKIVQLLSGAMTENVEKELLNISGAGVFQFCALTYIDATARDVRFRVVIDGTEVYDSSLASIQIAHSGFCAIGNYNGTNLNIQIMQIPFYSSFVVYATSTITETDKLKLWYMYYTV